MTARRRPAELLRERLLTRYTDRQRAEWDAAVRCSDIVRQAILDGHKGRWLAIRLSDGGSDRVPYPDKATAVRFQLHEQQCAYLRVPWDDMPPRAALSFLRTTRAVYDAGMRLSDPAGAGSDTDREIILPGLIEQTEAFLRRARARGLGLP